MVKEQDLLNQNNSFNDNISLKELFLKIKKWFSYLKSKWKILFFASLFGGIIGLIFAYFEKPTYKATLTFAMEDEKAIGSGIGGALGIASSIGIDLGGGGGGGVFAATNLTELMKSRLIVEKVLLSPININGETSTIAEFYIQINSLREKWNKHPDLRNIHFLPNYDRKKFSIQQDSILQIIYKRLIDKDVLSIMQKDKKVSILSIDVFSENELFSKIFCESIAKETSEFYIETKSKKARINTEVLQKQVDSVKKELNHSINGVAIENDNVYNLNPAFNIKSAPSKKRQIDVQANTSILTNLVVQLELSKINLRKETPLIQLIDKPILPLEKQKIGKLKWILICGLSSIFLSILYLMIKSIYKKISNY